VDDSVVFDDEIRQSPTVATTTRRTQSDASQAESATRGRGRASRDARATPSMPSAAFVCHLTAVKRQTPDPEPESQFEAHRARPRRTRVALLGPSEQNFAAAGRATPKDAAMLIRAGAATSVPRSLTRRRIVGFWNPTVRIGPEADRRGRARSARHRGGCCPGSAPPAPSAAQRSPARGSPSSPR
jgi:hypothetical protein